MSELDVEATLANGLVTIFLNSITEEFKVFEFTAITLGLKAGVGVEATGFWRSKHQPDDDLRPYLQITVFGGLFGADVENYWKSADAFNYKHEVTKYNILRIL